MRPEAVERKLRELLGELEALDMSLVEMARHDVSYEYMLKISLWEAGFALKEALGIVEKRKRRMN